MKNILKELLEKCKKLWNIIQQNRKIKYAVISGLLGVVIITIGIFTALGMKEATELPTNDTSRPAISTYDKTTIITIGGDESDSGSESETSDAPEESDSDSNATENIDDETTEGSNDTTNDPTDNEDTEGNDDPTPADPLNTEPQVTSQQSNTPSKNTQGTSNNPSNTQSTTKPPVTTQRTTNPPATTQSTTKPPVTTQKPTDPVVNSDAFEVQEKKYDYNGGNVTILNVKNLSSKAYTITIKGTYKDSSGKVLKTENKTFEGFPAGYENYFVFNPGIKYYDLSIDYAFKDYSGQVLANQVNIYGDNATIKLEYMHSDENGKVVYPTSPEEATTFPKYVSVKATVYQQAKNTYSKALMGTVDVVIFDNKGEICSIDSATRIFEPGEISFGATILVTNTLWENKDQYQLPDNLKNVTGIMAITSVTEY